jgi:hypothetical protein
VDLTHFRTIRRPVRADTILDWVSQIVRLVAGRRDDQHAALLGVPCGTLQFAQNRALSGVIGAVIEVWIGEQTQVDHVKLLITGVA